jgi:hypothetical protein
VEPQRSIAERTHLAAWGGFCAWAFFGTVSAFGLLIFGTVAVLPISLGVWLLVTPPSLRRSWVGVMTGWRDVVVHRLRAAARSRDNLLAYGQGGRL